VYNCKCNSYSLFTSPQCHQVSTRACRCVLRVFYALPTVQETRSKNAQLSRATTSCAWRHTNTYRSHGWNAVAERGWRGCRTPPVRRRKCRLLERHMRDVTRTRSGITDITLWRKPLAPAAIFCAASGTRSRQKRSKRWGRWNIVGPYVP